ncbi:MAG: hypothetical protein U0984_04765 [Prosthecobacter sp.]|nr:hypothetical protein [Prosthecobacter sp.]
MKMEEADAFDILKNLFLVFADGENEGQGPLWNNIESFVNRFALSGWSRKQVFELVRRIEDEWEGPIPGKCYDAISNYGDALLGDCHPTCIVRLPGEVAGDAEHLKYVRERKWLR